MLLGATRPLLASKKFRGYTGRRGAGTSGARAAAGAAGTASLNVREACAVLGVNPGPMLTMREVKEAGDQLRMRYHPDLAGGEASDKWYEVQDALKVVKGILEKRGGVVQTQKHELTDVHAQAHRSRNEWANATFSMYRVSKWRAPNYGGRGASKRDGFLGSSVQYGLLEEHGDPLDAEEFEKDSRSR